MTNARQPHPHAEIIKAWADGAPIQMFACNRWVDMKDEDGVPMFIPEYQYRIKPRPDVTLNVWVDDGDISTIACIRPSVYVSNATDGHNTQTNLRLTFDGVTGKLKAAEVL